MLVVNGSGVCAGEAVGKFRFNASQATCFTRPACVVINFFIESGDTVFNADSIFQKDSFSEFSYVT
jgi:hypothetical protein